MPQNERELPPGGSLWGEAFELGVKAGLAPLAYQLPDGYDVEDFEDA
ncbi:hypothetical protein [Thermococcus sp. JCM 11816]